LTNPDSAQPGAQVTRLLFVRHGEVENPDDLYYGRLPRFGLSEAGRRQVQMTGAHLASCTVAAIYSSTLLRARQTARILASPHPAAHVGISRLLLEVHSPFDGQPRQVLAKRGWDLYTGTVSPYEQPADLVARIQRFIRLMRRRFPGQTVVAVTHGDLIVFLTLWALGAPAELEQKSQLHQLGYAEAYPAPASVTTLNYRTSQEDERPSLSYWSPPTPAGTV